MKDTLFLDTLNAAYECASVADDHPNVPDADKDKLDRLVSLCKEVISSGRYEEFWQTIELLQMEK